MTQVITTEWRVLDAQKFIDTIVNRDNYYYMWAGHADPVSVTPLISTDTIDSSVDIYNNMIFGKQVQSTDIFPVFRNVSYIANTIYSAYDDGDPTLLTKDFYVVVDGGQGYNKYVFKCLDNNMGVPSTSAPDFNNLSLLDDTYTTSDGYVWKYMFSVDQGSYTKFAATTGMVPVIPNANVAALAVPGSIDVVAISNTGLGYSNYLLGTFGSSDCRVGGNTVIYSVSANNQSSPQSGFYTGCLIYISSGSGIGQNKLVTDYFSNTSGNYIVLDSDFSTPPMSGSTYEIYPNVVIVGDGNQSVNAAARAVINAVGNTVHRVEMLVKGQGYGYASATVTANSVVPVTQNAVIRPVYSPSGGHGSNPAVELGATSVAVAVTFANTEANTIPTQNGFRQIGLLHDPLFANVVVTTSNVVGTYISGESVYSITTLPIQANTSISNNIITGSGSMFDRQVNSGDYLYIKSNDGIYNSLVQVNAVTNSTSIVLSANVAWACTNVLVETVTIDGEYIARSSYGSGVVTLDNVTSDLVIGDFIIGSSSGAAGIVSTLTRNGVAKSFSTFVQLNVFVGKMNFGTFTQNETIYQGPSPSNTTATAVVHSVMTSGSNTTVYTTNNIGKFDPTQTTLGVSSGASFTGSLVDVGEIVPRSGEIIYAENISMVNRSNTTSENICIVLDF